MKKLVLFALLALLIVPAAFAVVTEMNMIRLETPLIRQGYQFAHIRGVNSNPDTALNVRHWHIMLEAGPNRARCEMQDNIVLPPGPFDVEIAVQCQTQSGMSTVFPIGRSIRLETFFDDDAPVAFYNPERITIETEPHAPRAGFPVEITGHAITLEQTNSTGTFLFLGGIGAIIALAATVILSSRRED